TQAIGIVIQEIQSGLLLVFRRMTAEGILICEIHGLLQIAANFLGQSLAKEARFAIDNGTVHEEQRLRCGDSLRTQRAGHSPIIDVEHLQEIRKDVAIGGVAADHVGSATIGAGWDAGHLSATISAPATVSDVKRWAANGEVQISRIGEN